MIRARMLTAGEAEGPVLSLDEPLSFWGAFEPRTGVILDVHHPQRGACVKDTVLVMTETRGSVGAEVAATLYGRRCVVACVTIDELERLRGARRIAIAADGVVTATP